MIVFTGYQDQKSGEPSINSFRCEYVRAFALEGAQDWRHTRRLPNSSLRSRSIPNAFIVSMNLSVPAEYSSTVKRQWLSDRLLES